MISKLSQEIYEKSIQLKNYDERKLILKRNRLTLLNELYQLQDMTDILLSSLHSDSSFSYNYIELAIFMKTSLAECIVYLTSKGKNYRTTIKRYICGFHNLPRAFLSIDNKMKVSTAEAMEYFKPYLKLD